MSRVFVKEIEKEDGEIETVKVELDNEIHISAFVNEGFKELKEEAKKKKKEE